MPEELLARIEVERAALRRRTAGLAVRIPELRTVPTSLAEQLVRHDPTWMPIENGWYRPRSLHNSPGLAEVQRMLTTLGALRMDVLITALGHMVVDSGTGERFTLPPERIFRALLLECGFAIDDMGTVSLGTLKSLRHPDSTIWRLLRIIRRHDESISRDELVALAGERGLSAEAVDAFLARGTLVRECGGVAPAAAPERATHSSPQQASPQQAPPQQAPPQHQSDI